MIYLPINPVNAKLSAPTQEVAVADSLYRANNAKYMTPKPRMVAPVITNIIDAPSTHIQPHPPSGAERGGVLPGCFSSTVGVTLRSSSLDSTSDPSVMMPGYVDVPVKKESWEYNIKIEAL